MTRLEKARQAMEDAKKRADERVKDYEELVKQEEEKTDKVVLNIVRKWSKTLHDKPEWSSIPKRLEAVLKGSETVKVKVDEDDNDLNT